MRSAIRSELLGVVLLLGLGACSTSTPDDRATAPASIPATATNASPSEPTLGRRDARRLGLQAVAALKRDEPARALALIARGADVNVADDIADSVFLYAGAEGYTRVVTAALAHGANVRSTNRYGGTALIPAAEHAHVEVIRILLAAGTPVDHVNDLGWTALGEAVALGNGDARHQEAVRLLLAAGADPTAVDRFGRTVLQNAVRLGFTPIAAQLRAAELRAGQPPA